MKKVYRLTLIAVFAIILISVLITNQKQEEVFSKLLRSNKQVIIEEKTIKILKGEIEGNFSDAKQHVVKTTLKSLNLNDWLKDPLLDYHIVFGNIHSKKGKELVVTISMGKDNGLIAIFAQSSNGYEMINTLTELAPIVSVDLIDLPGLAYQALVLDQYLDEMTGAFFESNTKSIYIFDNKLLTKIWERTNFSKELYPLNNQLEGDKTQWLMEKEEVDISFIEGKIKVNGINTKWRCKTLGDYKGEYEQVESKTINELYIWNKNKNTFEQLQ